MMTDYDFKAALDDFPDKWYKASGYMYKHKDTVLAALRIADRLQSGEVSDEMYFASAKSRKQQMEDFGITNIGMLFKAMAAQLLKEESDET